MSSSRDVPTPPWGPGFLSLYSWPYRVEYALATVAILLALFGGWPGLLRPYSAMDIALTVFWAAWPDLAAFIPIGAASRGSSTWPRWGPSLYNTLHSLLAWAVVFVAWTLLSGGIPWPLLGWAGHITADRAAGYYLRAPLNPDYPSGPPGA